MIKNTLPMIALLLLFMAKTWATQTADNETDFFSKSFKKGIPVQISNHRNADYTIRLNACDDYDGCPVSSGEGEYSENEIWFLVGNEKSFTLYNKVAGKEVAVKTGSNGEAVMTTAKNATKFALNRCGDDAFSITPVNDETLSFNMHGGKGKNIKLYDSSDAGSLWTIKRVDTEKPLTVKFNALTEGGYECNSRIGQFTITTDGVAYGTTITKYNIPSEKTYYLPLNAKFSLTTSNPYHGWKISIDGETTEQTMPDGGMTATMNIEADKNNRYQYLFYSPDSAGIPYRIPAIATTANGYVVAINDYRPCGGDIGCGEVDLVMRHSTAAWSDWDGHSWSDPVTIADGQGKQATETWQVGYGDPAIVADREKNEILVMSVCGNRLCWHGNYGAGTESNPENPNRVSRLRIKYNEQTCEWEAGKPEEVTYEIYPLFKDAEGVAHVGSLFIGAGRIAQSSKIKIGDYYRIYCAVWAVANGSSRHHNYAIYSDDFGETWKLLGELGTSHADSPAPYGNEPKCEELPDGSVLLSSRKAYGRYFNVFRYSDVVSGTGTWEGVVATDAKGDLKWGSNDTNGEPLRCGNVLFQSAPTGNKRSDVAIFYKVLSNDAATYTPEQLSSGWIKCPISTTGSAYSSMCLLPDGKSIGIYYEEEPGYYSMVYLPIDLKEILSPEAYEALETPVLHEE